MSSLPFQYIKKLKLDENENLPIFFILILYVFIIYFLNKEHVYPLLIRGP